MSSKNDNGESYSYAKAGVNIAAGNALVKAIGPLARATARPGADAELGGFGGFFDLRAAGYKDPLLVAGNDGVGTKVKLAIDHDRHDAIGIDLVAMCVNDLIVQGAEIPAAALIEYHLLIDNARGVHFIVGSGGRRGGWRDAYVCSLFPVVARQRRSSVAR